jgi:alkaline phosphatase D
MHETRPDFLIHCGDTIYADGPILPEVTEPDGHVWRNLVTQEVSKVAQSLEEFRGRHRPAPTVEVLFACSDDAPCPSTPVR